MLTSEFDFDLPTDRIAQEPPERGTSRLLVVEETGDLQHRKIDHLPQLLRAGDLLVVNNTRVIPARLFARTARGRRVEILLVERTSRTEWQVLVKPGRLAKPGTQLLLAEDLSIEVLEISTAGRRQVRFSRPIEPRLERLGHIPLPPYIKRPDRPGDRDRYQTVYASQDGAIAAPTAGLHFTRALLEALRSAGVGVAELTLHVGIGTFKPVTATLVHEHRMEPERVHLPEETAAAIAATRAQGGRVVAVGTTVVRTLEWAAQQTPNGEAGVLPGSGRADLFISPGFEFRVVDLMLTNFHLPKSTLLMMVCAFAGRSPVLNAYQEALQKGYRFYSYGDAMFLSRRRS